MPFTIRNYAYIDGCGCETVTWIREFATSTPRRFDAYLIYSEQRGKLVDYLGTHQHLAVDIDLAVDDRGGLKLRSGEQRFYEGPIAFNFPMVLSGVANVCEWFEESDGNFTLRSMSAMRCGGRCLDIVVGSRWRRSERVSCHLRCCQSDANSGSNQVGKKRDRGTNVRGDKKVVCGFS